MRHVSSFATLRRRVGVVLAPLALAALPMTFVGCSEAEEEVVTPPVVAEPADGMDEDV